MVSLTTATTALNPNQEMTDFDYKKYSLENLENWLHDAMSSGGATPHEIYDVIVGVVKETHEHHKQEAEQAEELLNLLNSGWTKEEVLKDREYYEPSGTFTFSSCSADDTSPECMTSWNDFWSDDKITSIHNTEDGDLFAHNKDKVVKWRLPVEVDSVSGEYYFTLPEDLLEQTGWKEDDALHWVDNGDGSFTLERVEESEETEL
jgi:hypothetical protein